MCTVNSTINRVNREPAELNKTFVICISLTGVQDPEPIKDRKIRNKQKGKSWNQ